MAPCTINSLTDPKAFCFQFSAILFTLFLLTKSSCYFGCTVTGLGTAIVLVFATWKITNLIRRLFFRETLSAHKKAVLVTGCDSGFGNRLANRLNNKGYTVFAGCLDPNGALPQELLKTAAFPKATKLLKMDVTSDGDVARVLEEVSTSLKKEGLQLWAIVNNAGIAYAGHIEWGKLENYYKVLEVNTFAMVRVTRAFLPLLRQSQGRVVNVASMAGRAASPGMASYCMSKHAAVAFSASLRGEMWPWGVKVSTIEPSFYKTPIIDLKRLNDNAKKVWDETSESVREDYGEGYFDSTIQMLDIKAGRDNPEEVVDAMFDAIAAVEPQVAYRVCGPDFAFLWFLVDMLPYATVDWIFRMIPQLNPKEKPAKAVMKAK